MRPISHLLQSHLLHSTVTQMAEIETRNIVWNGHLRLAQYAIPSPLTPIVKWKQSLTGEINMFITVGKKSGTWVEFLYARTDICCGIVITALLLLPCGRMWSSWQETRDPSAHIFIYLFIYICRCQACQGYIMYACKQSQPRQIPGIKPKKAQYCKIN